MWGYGITTKVATTQGGLAEFVPSLRVVGFDPVVARAYGPCITLWPLHLRGYFGLLTPFLLSFSFCVDPPSS
jgi:hypothetical protein